MHEFASRILGTDDSCSEIVRCLSVLGRVAEKQTVTQMWITCRLLILPLTWCLMFNAVFSLRSLMHEFARYSRG